MVGGDAIHPGGHPNPLRQQMVLARFGELALRSENLDEILTEACHLLGDALGTDLAKVMELEPDGRTLLVRAGVGWKPGVVGKIKLTAEDGSSEAYALSTGAPVISPDIAEERRFRYASFLTENGVRAIVNVPIIGGKDRPPFGVLQVDSRVPRQFTDDDIIFLRSYANLLAAAVDRLRILGEMREQNARLERQVAREQEAAERQAFLAQELDHRAKNMLAVVQAALRLTRADDMPSYVRAIEGRVATLARAQTLLAADRWSGADLHTLLRGELAPFLGGEGAGPRVNLLGPVVALPAGAAQPFSMAIHELTTNATKYGGLSNSDGLLVVSWLVGEPPESFLRLRWTETGGPRTDGPPSRQGFGSRVLNGTVRFQLGGTAILAWQAEGLICDIAVPLGRMRRGGAIAQDGPALDGPALGDPRLDGLLNVPPGVAGASPARD